MIKWIFNLFKTKCHSSTQNHIDVIDVDAIALQKLQKTKIDIVDVADKCHSSTQNHIDVIDVDAITRQKLQVTKQQKRIKAGFQAEKIFEKQADEFGWIVEKIPQDQKSFEKYKKKGKQFSLP